MDNIPADYWLMLCKLLLLTVSMKAPFGGRFLPYQHQLISQSGLLLSLYRG